MPDLKVLMSISKLAVTCFIHILVACFNIFNVFGSDYGNFDILSGTLTSSCIEFCEDLKVGIIILTSVIFQMTLAVQVLSEFKVVVIINNLTVQCSSVPCGFGRGPLNVSSEGKINSSLSKSVLQFFSYVAPFLPAVEIIFNQLSVTVDHQVVLKAAKLLLRGSVGQKHQLLVELSGFKLETVPHDSTVSHKKHGTPERLFELTTATFVASITPVSRVVGVSYDLDCSVALGDTFVSLSAPSIRTVTELLATFLSHTRPSVERILQDSLVRYTALVHRLQRIDEDVSSGWAEDSDDDGMYYPTILQPSAVENESKGKVKISCKWGSVVLFMHHASSADNNPVIEAIGGSLSATDVLALHDLSLSISKSDAGTQVAVSVKSISQCILDRDSSYWLDDSVVLSSVLETGVDQAGGSEGNWFHFSLAANRVAENSVQRAVIDCKVALFHLSLHTNALAVLLFAQNEIQTALSTANFPFYSANQRLSEAEQFLSLDISQNANDRDAMKFDSIGVVIEGVTLSLISPIGCKADGSAVARAATPSGSSSDLSGGNTGEGSVVVDGELSSNAHLVVTVRNIATSGSSEAGLSALCGEIKLSSRISSHNAAPGLNLLSSERMGQTMETGEERISNPFFSIDSVRVYAMLECSAESARHRYNSHADYLGNENASHSTHTINNSARSDAMSTAVTVESIAVDATQFDMVCLGTTIGALKGSMDTYNPMPEYLSSPYKILTVAPTVPRSVNIDIAAVGVTLTYVVDSRSDSRVVAGISNKIVYKILESVAVDIESTSAGLYYSNTNVYYSTNSSDNNSGSNLITLKRNVISTDERDGDSELTVESATILTVTPISSCDSNSNNSGDDTSSCKEQEEEATRTAERNRILLYSSKSVVNAGQLHMSNSSYLGLYTPNDYSLLRLPTVVATIDIVQITHLMWFIRAFSATQSHGMGVMKRIFYSHSFDYHSHNTLLHWSNKHVVVPSTPTAISATVVHFFRLNFFHTLLPVFSLSAEKTELHSLAFGATLSQLAVSLTSLKLFEFSASSAVHTYIVGDINNGSVAPNRVEMHMTSAQGQCGLLEFHGEYLQVKYLQRPTLTLVNYIRDYLIRDLWAGLSSLNTDEAISLPTVPYVPLRGMFRLGAVVHTSEVHLPNNSCGTDSLTVLFKNATVYKSSEEMAAQDANYCKGPYVAKNTWMSELTSSKKVIQYYFSSRSDGEGRSRSNTFTGDSGPLSSLQWSLASLVSTELTPPAAVLEHGASVFILEIGLFEGTICSWCNSNAVGENMNLTCQFSMFPAHRLEDDLYASELEEIGISLLESERNTMHVHVWAEELEWTLAQGQYLGIVNLIQQNFCELQETVIDEYIIPTPKNVELFMDGIYGKYALDDRLPTISSVPIHIASGRIIAVQNLPDYYKLFTTPLEHKITISDVNGSAALLDTVPSQSYHNYYRNKLLTRVFGQSAAQGVNKKDNGLNRHLSSALNKDIRFINTNSLPVSTNTYTSSSMYKPDYANACSGMNITNIHLTGDPVIAIHFTHLEIDFFRRHYGGGNGIEVSAVSFVIVAAGGSEDEGDDRSADLSQDLEEVSVENIIFAPKSFSLLNTGKYRDHRRGSTASRQSRGYRSPLRFASQSAGTAGEQNSRSPRSRRSTTLQSTSEEAGAPVVPCIRYSQQGLGNLRRCVVEIVESVAVANMAKILDTVAYFMKPIDVIEARNLAVIARNDLLGPYDYKAALDVEVHLKNTVLCMSNLSQREGASAMCMHMNFSYLHHWRGFLICGPGKIGYTISADIMSVYIAPMHEIYSSAIQSLVDACKVEFNMDLTILPEEQYLEEYLAKLSPWISIAGCEWVTKKNPMPHPSATRLLRVKVCPTVEDDDTNPYFPPSNNDTVQTLDTPPTTPPSTPLPEQHEHSVEVSDVHSDDDNETSRSVTPEPKPRQDSDAPAVETPVLAMRLSLKDINFIIVAVQQLKTNLSQRIRPKSGSDDPYLEMVAMESDMDHLPTLNYWLVSIVQTAAWRPDNKELLVDMCDYTIVLRNNTYNLNILKLDIFEICTIYNRSPLRLHMASGLSCACWAYNDNIDEWEPLVEPINMRSIGATDASKNSQSYSVSRASRIKIEVVTDPLELNAPLSTLVNLIRKLSLADVVTTSSIHLPPYKVVNDLGVHMKFTIGMGGGVITNNEIATGKFLPIEVNQLTEALNNYKLRRQYNSVSRIAVGGRNRSRSVTENNSTANREYRMGISFANFKSHYRSRCPAPIDKEGIYPFEMQVIVDESEQNADKGERKRMISLSLGRKHSNAGPSAAALALTVPTSTESTSTLQTEDCESPEAAATDIVVAPSVSEGTPVLASHSTKSLPPPHTSPVKFIQEVPLAILDMRIKDDGVRELLLRSILSLKNHTSRVFQVSVRLYGSSAEMALAPGREWNVPVRYANPKASLFFRLDERSEWIEGLPTFQHLITSGYWGSPSRMKAELCTCPPENSNHSPLPSDSSGHSVDPNWIVLIKPEARDHKVAQQQGSAKTFIPVRYPTREVHRTKGHPSSSHAAMTSDAVQESEDGVLQIQDIYNVGSTLKTRGAQPLCIQFLAPLQLCNLLSQPMIYRLADASGLITSEGVLLPGEIVDIHSLFKLFLSKIFISIRMLNYCWSKWAVVFGRSSPYSIAEKSVDITLHSMNFMYQTKELSLPPLDINMITKEHLVRFVCPVVISNRTGLQLEFCESSNQDSFIPQSSRSAIETYIPVNNNSTSSNQLKLHTLSSNVKKNAHALLLEEEKEEDGYSSDTDEEDDPKASARTKVVDGIIPTGRSVKSVYSGRMRRGSGQDSDDEDDSASEDGDVSISNKTPMFTPAAGSPLAVQQSPSASMKRQVSSEKLTPRVGKILTLTIHLPHDHLRKVELIASSDWTLSDVFAQIKQQVAVSSDHQHENNYVFFGWENGKFGPRKVDNSLIIDEAAESAGAAPDSFANVVSTAMQQQSGAALVGNSTEKHEAHAEKESRIALAARLLRRKPSTDSVASTSSTSSSVSTVHQQSSSAEAEIPAPMLFDMLADCSLTPLPMDTKLESLKGLRLRLCHDSEWSIFKQVKAIKSEVVGKEGLFSSMFSRTRYTHHTNFVKIDGDFPFRPHRMLGFSPALSLRVPFETEWSEAVDVFKADFDVSELTISVGTGTSKPGIAPSTQLCHSFYEFGAYIERGKGFLQNITTVTIVAKHILVSKLSVPLEIRQINVVDNYTPLCLFPGTVQSYHFPVRSKSKLLQIRRYSATSDSDTSLNSAQFAWAGEIDIDNLGIMYAKLRDPPMIVKVQVECIGASLVTTLTQQSAKWPPYRIDNMTSIDIRYKQSLTGEQVLLASGSSNSLSSRSKSAKLKGAQTSQLDLYSIAEEGEEASGKDNSTTSGSGTMGNSSLSSSLRSNSVVDTPALDRKTSFSQASNPLISASQFSSALFDYDYLAHNSTGSFAWDLPFSGNKLLKLEFAQGMASQQGAQTAPSTTSVGGINPNQVWVSKEISLDDDSKMDTVQIKTNLPSLGNPLAEGYLVHYNATTDCWVREYCILRPYVLYIYEDETRSTLTKLVNMSHYNHADQVQLSCVVRYTDGTSWGLMNFFGSVIGGSKDRKATAANSAATTFDSNKVRVMILKIAEFLGLLSHVTKETKRKSSEDDEEDIAVSNSVSNGATQISSETTMSIDKPSGVVSDILDTVESPGVFYDEEVLSVPLPATARNELLEDIAVIAEIAAVTKDDAPLVELNVESELDLKAVERDSEPSKPPLSPSRCVSPVGPSLVDLLKDGVSVEQLLEEASNLPVRVSDIVTALLGTNEVSNLDKASEVCSWMLAEGFLIARGARRAIDSSNPLHYSDDEAEPRGEMHSDEEWAEEEDQLSLSQALSEGTGSGMPRRNSMQELGPDKRRESMSFGGNIRASMVSEEVPPVKKEVVPVGKEASHTRRNSKGKHSKHDLLSEYQNVDLFLNPPTLNPELAAMLNSDYLAGSTSRQSMSTNSTQSNGKGAAEEEVFGFSLLTDAHTKFHFKCASEMEFLGWIQACRQAIEITWVDHELGRKTEKDHLSLDHFQMRIMLKLRADGPTKVLEIIEDVQENDHNSHLSSPNRRRNLINRKEKRKSKLLPFNLKFDRLKSMNKSLLRGLDHDPLDNEDNEQVLSVVFAVQSVALSLIDSEPAELLYLSLSGIEMSIERTTDTVKFSGTVQEIQLSNQLLNPEFPVALFPRRMKPIDATALAAGQGRLMLPGLNPNRSSYPSLHLFLQQKYHQTISEIDATTSSAVYEQETKLRYFDMFTLWIAPIQLDVDEEIIVKVLRYAQDIRAAIFKSDLSDLSGLLNDEILSLSQQTNKTWGSIDPRAVYEVYMQLLAAGKRPYTEYGKVSKNSSAVYFSLLQLHPLDLVISFRPSPNLVVSNAELAIISIISQLDCARICLNALIAEHAFGTTSFIMDILGKHYRAAFWRQFHKLIGTSDFVEGSVGLVANLGTGVYDLFYEPIDGLLDQNGSFLDGLSKGGKSLASRAIGGTSGFTSKITGGIGKGVSLLTLDSEFQRNRSYRRFNKTSTVSEGLYVGTRELGKNVVEGVTGIVMSPYRGWETGGGVGFGLGVAKGILGVALKPAVGVFDLASRATEGIRNTAFSVDPDMIEERYGIHRKRIPRSFGRSGSVIVYNVRNAAAQYVADSLTGFKQEPRLQVIHHQHIVRKVVNTPVYTALFLHNISVSNYKVENNTLIADELEHTCKEAWSLLVDISYVLLVCRDRVALVQMIPPTPAAQEKRRGAKKPPLNRKLIWSCPAQCIEQFYHDARGDLVLSVNSSVCIQGAWNASAPVLLDHYSRDYLIFQSLLEQTIGVRLARQQPLTPASGMIQGGILKRYSSGIRGLLMSPSKHTYRLFGNVLFEYTANKKKGAAESSKLDASAHDSEDGAQPAAADEIATNSEEYINKIISKLFLQTPNTAAAASAEQIAADMLLHDTYLSFVYPLVDLYIVGPSPEDNGSKYSITLSRIDNTKMRTLRKEEEGELLAEYQKISLSLIFSSFEAAGSWRKAIESHVVFRVNDALPAAPLTTEEKKKSNRSLIRTISSAAAEEVLEPAGSSILGVLVIPTSGCNPLVTEAMKIEIAKTMTEMKQ